MVVFLRVLLFADVLSNRKLLAMLLKNKGFEATACEDGMQAFNLITNMGDIDYYDVIFMDNTMPVMVSANFASPKYLCICSNLCICHNVDWNRVCTSAPQQWILQDHHRSNRQQHGG
jgi:hypothetical protein